MSDNKRKCMVICLLALFIGLMGIVLPEQEEIAFEYIVNNTDLYNNGRITGTNYTANDSAIQLFLIFHVIGTGASLVVDTNLSINGTVVEDRDYRTTAGAGIHEHFSMTAHIPKGANYSVTNSSNLETMEWREYPILTGRNGTLSITQTGCVGDCAFNNLTVNSLGKNDTSDYFVSNIHLLSPLFQYGIGEAFYSKIDISDGYTNLLTTRASDNNYSNIYKTPEIIRMEVSNANNNFFEIRQNESVYDVFGRLYTYNITHFDMGGANLTNCANCGGNQNLSQVLTQGYDANTQGISNLSNITGRTGINLNITGFDKVNMYQDTDYNENNLSRVYNIAMNITNGSYNTFTMLGSSSTPFFTAYENGTMRHEMSLGGTQIWRLRGADSAPAEVGYISYSTPGSNPGIAIFNSSLLNRIDIASTNNGFEFYVYPNASSVRPSSPALVINRTQKIVIPAMAGAGDAYVCVDANGALFRKASACA